jgi:hypothetical protein
MKILMLSLLISLSSFSLADTYMVDTTGVVKAFIDDQDGTIYLWDGRPAAYLTTVAPNTVTLKSGESHIYGFNGQHLGWYHQGHFWDHDMSVFGMEDSVYTGYTKKEGNQGLKRYKPYHHIKQLAPFYKKIQGDSWSEISMVNVLLSGS